MQDLIRELRQLHEHEWEARQALDQRLDGLIGTTQQVVAWEFQERKGDGWESWPKRGLLEDKHSRIDVVGVVARAERTERGIQVELVVPNQARYRVRLMGAVMFPRPMDDPALTFGTLWRGREEVFRIGEVEVRWVHSRHTIIFTAPDYTAYVEIPHQYKLGFSVPDYALVEDWIPPEAGEYGIDRQTGEVFPRVEGLSLEESRRRHIGHQVLSHG
jgi:hypothetical protein